MQPMMYTLRRPTLSDTAPHAGATNTCRMPTIIVPTKPTCAATCFAFTR